MKIRTKLAIALKQFYKDNDVTAKRSVTDMSDGIGTLNVIIAKDVIIMSYTIRVKTQEIEEFKVRSVIEAHITITEENLNVETMNKAYQALKEGCSRTLKGERNAQVEINSKE